MQNDKQLVISYLKNLIELVERDELMPVYYTAGNGGASQWHRLGLVDNRSCTKSHDIEIISTLNTLRGRISAMRDALNRLDEIINE